MKKRSSIFTLLLLTHALMIGQQHIGNIELAINPTPLLHREHRLSISCEKATGKNTSLNLSLGYGNTLTSQVYKTIYSIDNDDNYQFYEIRPEFRYYLPFFTIPAYLACELFYLQLQKTMYDDWYSIDITNIHINYTRADITKEKYGLTLIGGLKPYIFNNKYYIEVFSGLGLANRVSSFKNVQTKADYDDFFTIFDGGYHTQGTKLIVNMVAGIRIGLVVKNKNN